jgi:hypothetical protein
LKKRTVGAIKTLISTIYPKNIYTFVIPIIPKNSAMPSFFSKIKNKLQQLSFRTGVIITLCCIPFYILSFAQMALDIDVKTKGILWVVLFGLAKIFQYTGLTILGVEGYKRLKQYFKKK